MAKKEVSLMEKVKFVFYIILGSIIIGTTLFGIDRHYAKTSAVEVAVIKSENGDKSLQELVDITIKNSEVFQQEQTIQRIEDWKRYEQRKEEPVLTPIEKETLEKAKKRLAELKSSREEQIKHYKNKDH